MLPVVKTGSPIFSMERQRATTDEPDLQSPINAANANPALTTAVCKWYTTAGPQLKAFPRLIKHM